MKNSLRNIRTSFPRIAQITRHNNSVQIESKEEKIQVIKNNQKEEISSNILETKKIVETPSIVLENNNKSLKKNKKHDNSRENQSSEQPS